MKILIYLSFLILLAMSPNLHAEAPEPATPPANNPNPPQAPADQKRVDFAETAIQLFLKESPTLPTLGENSTLHTQDFLNKDLICLKDPACFQKDLAWMHELSGIRERYGTLVEQKHAHIIPWSYENFQKNQSSIKSPESAPIPRQTAGGMIIMQGPRLKADEYMIHIYARFSKQEGQWHHLDVILTEGPTGDLSLRHFFIMPMLQGLPPGVQC